MKLTRRVLHHRAKPCDFKYPYQNQQLMHEMLDVMRKEKGIGLSATQVGITKRVFVMAVNGRVRGCFNPEIIDSDSEPIEFSEGCLSFPGDSCKLKRPDKILVKYQDHEGNWIEDAMTGLESRCFQHELDHLNGITMWDRQKEQNAE